jgi:metal-sulfur cluster biosynthetic enzyme
MGCGAEVVDPEIPVLTIADLGVLRDVSIVDGQVEVRSRRPIQDARR